MVDIFPRRIFSQHSKCMLVEFSLCIGTIICIMCVFNYTAYIVEEYRLATHIMKKNTTNRHRHSVNMSHTVQEWVPRYTKPWTDYPLYSQSFGIDHNIPKKYILLALPLGQRTPSLYLPILKFLGVREYCYITWDYRGFYRSKGRDAHGLCEHIVDAFAILDAYKIDKIDIVIGHSMGATVAAGMAAQAPQRIGQIILLNYTPGHVYRHAFAPLCPLQCSLLREWCIRELLNMFRTRPTLFRKLCVLCNIPLRIILYIVSCTFYYDEWLADSVFTDTNYLLTLFNNYTTAVCTSDKTLSLYFKTFDQMNNFMVCEQNIIAPTLLIGGIWDIFTPVSVYRQSVQNMHNAVYICDVFSTHVTIIENTYTSCCTIASFIHKNTTATHICRKT